MDRSLYPEGVEVRQADLGNTENTRAFHILKRGVDNCNTGIVSGLLVTPDGVNVNITKGYGYAPDGELVELLSSISGTQLSNYTSDVKNYILLVYTETHDDIRPHKTSGNSLPTKAVRSYRLVILTEAAYIALPTTDNNLDNNALDRSLVIAIVTAQGSGVNLASSNVELATNFGGGTSAIITGSMPGVDILRISSETITGIGILSFVYVLKELTWIAPGDTSGTAVDVSSGGVFVLTSQPTNVTLTVLVADTILPTTNASTEVSVTNIYTQNVIRNTTRDDHHRSFIGSGIPSSNNPHGLTSEDLGIGETSTQFHQEIFHANGISPDSDSGFLTPSINTGSIPHSISYVPPISGDKVYLGGFLHTILNSTSILFADVVDDAHALFETYAVIGSNNNTASLEKRERARYVAIPPPPMSTVAQLRDISENMPSGTAQIKYTLSGNLVEFKAPGDATFGDAIAVGYYAGSAPGIIRLFNNTGEHWIDIYANDVGTWSAAMAAGATEDLLISSGLTNAESSDRLKLSSTIYSGASTGFLGNGFGLANSPNEPNKKHVQGLIDGHEIKSGFNAVGYNGIGHLTNKEGRVSIGQDNQPHATGRKICLTVGDTSDNQSISLRVMPTSILPTNLTFSDMGSLIFYEVDRKIYVWDGTVWRSF